MQSKKNQLGFTTAERKRLAMGAFNRFKSRLIKLEQLLDDFLLLDKKLKDQKETNTALVKAHGRTQKRIRRAENALGERYLNFPSNRTDIYSYLAATVWDPDCDVPCKVQKADESLGLHWDKLTAGAEEVCGPKRWHPLTKSAYPSLHDAVLAGLWSHPKLGVLLLFDSMGHEGTFVIWARGTPQVKWNYKGYQKNIESHTHWHWAAPLQKEHRAHQAYCLMAEHMDKYTNQVNQINEQALALSETAKAAHIKKVKSSVKSTNVCLQGLDDYFWVQMSHLFEEEHHNFDATQKDVKEEVLALRFSMKNSLQLRAQTIEIYFGMDAPLSFIEHLVLTDSLITKTQPPPESVEGSLSVKTERRTL